MVDKLALLPTLALLLGLLAPELLGRVGVVPTREEVVGVRPVFGAGLPCLLCK